MIETLEYTVSVAETGGARSDGSRPRAGEPFDFDSLYFLKRSNIWSAPSTDAPVASIELGVDRDRDLLQGRGSCLFERR